jgi:hypothetical protein
MDLLWEAALLSSSWTTRVVDISAQTTISFQSVATAANGNGTAEIDDSGSGLGSVVLHSIIAVQGSTSNNFLCKVMAVAAGTIEVIPLNSSNDLTDEIAGDSVTIVRANYITDGDTCRAFTIEREYQDLTNVFELFNGMVPGGFGLTIPTEGIVTGSFSFTGSKAVNPSPTATAGDGSPNASEATDVMNSIDNILSFTENNADFDIVSFGLTGNNNLRGRRQVGNVGVVSVGAGRFEMSGTLQAYFANSTFFDKYLGFTETKWLFAAQDNAGNVYIFDIPAIKLTSGQRVAGGINTDIIADMGWAAKKAATEGYMLRVHRMDSADAPAVT